ncbi:MAG TPA: tRNA pseudouridine(38-40) synthase TruA [Xanthomonadales bacterium]|nr:tRNA pseudouridine(38-40) synthase TruA [Xanthomonadales bacterium]
MTRLAAGLEYDGSRFLGWQIQKQEPTVQSCVQRALSEVADHPVVVTASGRTDAGVHAIEQVIHFDTGSDREERSWILGMNSHLPRGISGLWVRPVSDEFHARFCAVTRRYRYIILNRQIRPALDTDRVTWCRQPLDAEAMNVAAQSLQGEHDFTSFRASACQARHPVREIREISVRRSDAYVILDITANAFLYHMVRNIAGSLMAVGKGDRSGEWIGEILAARNRDLADVTAAPNGLYFYQSKYPSEFDLPGGLRPFPWRLAR